jgi:hypothetical protein
MDRISTTSLILLAIAIMSLNTTNLKIARRGNQGLSNNQSADSMQINVSSIVQKKSGPRSSKNWQSDDSEEDSEATIAELIQHLEAQNRRDGIEVTTLSSRRLGNSGRPTPA